MRQFIFILTLIFTASVAGLAQANSMPNVDSLLKNETVFPMQFSFVHPIGSNGLNNVNVYNKISINALVGRSKGVIGAEFSGLMSQNTSHAIGCKASGIIDVVGGSLMGMQAGGIMATVNGSSKGVQAGGILATTGKKFHGLQAGGILATVGDSMQGVQAGGILSVCKGSFEGLQAGGIMATTGGSMNGLQAAGIMATTNDSLEGMQAAGIVSICNGSVNGMQASGILNKAGFLDGLQVGLINIADSVSDKSVQLGLVNINRKGGIMRFGVMSTEFINATAFLKSGTQFFHGYVGLGSQLNDKDYRFATMLGVGSSFKLANRLYFEPEWMMWFINNGQFVYNNRMSELQQLRAMFSFSAGKKGPYISAGPTINLAYSSYRNANGERGINLAPSYFYNKTLSHGSTNVRAWIGYSVAVSFGR